ncbi:M23 family metallopeptidase [Oleisolibacter albus]|uniref:M23 family metallopeptidase n=1 Tax=Oleisolibacter albus TaxID=2171757 RepID=UPI001EFC60C3|nr:M23 family metallopeptidase [Oleisolibacter albus]
MQQEGQVVRKRLAWAGLTALGTIGLALLLTHAPFEGTREAPRTPDGLPMAALPPVADSGSTAAAVPAIDLDAGQGPNLAGEAWGDLEQDADPVQRRLVSLGRGETLMQLLLEANVPQDNAHEAVTALTAVYNPRRLKPGQEFEVLFDRSSGERKFVGFTFQPTVERSVSVNFDGARFQAAETAKPLERRLVAAKVEINSSLFEAGSRAGVPIAVLSALLKNYAYNVDFQRDIQPGDGFEILYEQFVTPEGDVARDGEIHYAALTLSGKRKPIYRFDDGDGPAEYFNALGESVRKALLRTPVDGARLTSGFGMRMHPVLGFSKMHKGVDFGAPTGTPIYAAGDGTIDEVGPKGSYGNYVRIRHNREISTAYAHMSRFGTGLRRGARVSQGQVIGYVGATGRVTGAHLHYEVLRGTQQVNPLSVDLPTGRNLEGKTLARFKATIAQTDKQFQEALSGVALVAAPADAAVKGKGCRVAPGC